MLRYEELTECGRCHCTFPVAAPVLIAYSCLCDQCAIDDVYEALEWLKPRDWLQHVRETCDYMEPIVKTDSHG